MFETVLDVTTIGEKQLEDESPKQEVILKEIVEEHEEVNTVQEKVNTVLESNLINTVELS